VASPQSVTFTWSANTEADLDQYIIMWGHMTNGVITYNNSFQVTKAQAIAAGHTLTLIPASLPLSFTRDGLYWFNIRAMDTTGNLGPLTTPLSKRIVRVANKLRARR
jgi:hypothetical protein